MASLLTLSACGGDRQESGEQGSTGQQTAGGDAGDRTGDIPATKGEDGGGGGRSSEVSLEIGGDPGTDFSGMCSVGDEESELSGQAPESFGYDPNGRRMECEIRNEGSGSLEIVLDANGTRSVQQLSAGTLNLTYADGLVSLSTSSGPGGQVISSSVNSSSSTSSSSVSSSSVNSSSSSSSP